MDQRSTTPDVDPALADAVAARLVEGRQATAAKLAIVVAGICLLLSPAAILFPLALVMLAIAAWGVGRRPAHRREYVITAVLAGLAAFVTVALTAALLRSEGGLGPDDGVVTHVESSTSVTSTTVVPEPTLPAPAPKGSASLEPVPSPT